MIWNKKKNLYVLILVISFVLFLSACEKKREVNKEDDEQRPSEQKQMTLTKDGKIGFMLPAGWAEEETDVYDLGCSNESSFMGVFVYHMQDFAEGQTKEDVFQFHIEDLMSKREDAKEIEPLTNLKEENKSRIYRRVYTADLEKNKGVYCFNLLDFGQDQDIFVYVVFIAKPSDMNQSLEEEWNKILFGVEILS